MTRYSRLRVTKSKLEEMRQKVSGITAKTPVEGDLRQIAMKLLDHAKGTNLEITQAENEIEKVLNHDDIHPSAETTLQRALDRLTLEGEL